MGDLMRAYETFCRVVERGSLSRAAIDLDMAQATVSRHLQELERRYQTVLVTRTTRSLQVSPAGQQVYDYASAVLRSEVELGGRIAGSALAMSGRVRIAGPLGFGHAVLNPLVLEIARQHPQLRLALVLSERPVNLVEEGIDVAIRIGRQRDSSLWVRPLAQLAEVLVAAPALMAPRWRPAGPAQLAGLPRVALSMASTRDLSLRQGEDVQVIDAAPVYETDSSLALRDALLAGLGYGAIHRYLVADAIAAGRLIELLPDWTLPSWPLHALFAARTRSARVDFVVDQLAQRLQALPIR